MFQRSNPALAHVAAVYPVAPVEGDHLDGIRDGRRCVGADGRSRGILREPVAPFVGEQLYAAAFFIAELSPIRLAPARSTESFRRWHGPKRAPSECCALYLTISKQPATIAMSASAPPHAAIRCIAPRFRFASMLIA